MLGFENNLKYVCEEEPFYPVCQQTSTFNYSKEFAKLTWGSDFTTSQLTFTFKTYNIDERNVFMFIS